MALKINLKLITTSFAVRSWVGGEMQRPTPPLSKHRASERRLLPVASRAQLRQTPSLLRKLSSLTFVLYRFPSFCLEWACLKTIGFFFEPQSHSPLT